jgi:thioesterase domain-containing protein
LALAKVHGALPEETNVKEFMQMVAVYQANIRACERYEAPIFDGGITLFQPSSKGWLNGRYLKSVSRFWQRHAISGCDTIRVPSDHMTIVKSPAVGIIAGRLRQQLSHA